MSNEARAATPRTYLLKLGGEAVLIVVSVFVAIMLESMWQDRSEARDAREALAQVRMSLVEDKAFFDLVEQEQLAAAARIQALIRWLENPRLPADDKIREHLESYSMPISIWPRRAAWDTMVNAGQLRLLGAPELTTRIGDYYEHHLRRIEYNGRQYDDVFVDVFEGDVPAIWDFQQGQFLTTDPDRITGLRNRLVQLNSWVGYYLASVDKNRRLLEGLIEDIDRYLR